MVGFASCWLVGTVPAGFVNMLIADEYGWPGAHAFIARVVLWPIFVLKLIILVLLAGWRDLWS